MLHQPGDKITYTEYYIALQKLNNHNRKKKEKTIREIISVDHENKTYVISNNRTGINITVKAKFYRLANEEEIKVDKIKYIFKK